MNDVDLLALRYVFDKIDGVMNINVGGIAKDNYTSPSVIIRLAKNL